MRMAVILIILIKMTMMTMYVDHTLGGRKEALFHMTARSSRHTRMTDDDDDDYDNTGDQKTGVVG